MAEGESEGDGGTQEGTTTVASNWRDNLPSDVREWDEAKNAQDADSFFQQMAAHRRMIGQSLRIPGKDAGEEAMNEFYSKVQDRVDGLMRVPDMNDDQQALDTFRKLGAPEDADGYSDPSLEGFDASKAEYNEFKGMALKAGLTKKQFDKLAASIAQREVNAGIQAKESLDGEIAKLKGEWGNAYEQRINVAANMAAKTGAPESLCEAIRTGQVDTHTAKWMYELSQQLGGEVANFTGSQVNEPTPAELEASIQDIMGDLEGPYWDAKHPAHKRYVDKVLDMRRKMA